MKKTSVRFSAALLALLLTFCVSSVFTACGNAGTGTVTPDVTTEASPSETEAPEAEPSFSLSAAVEYDVTLVRPAPSNAVTDSLSVAFSTKLSELTGKHILTETDSVNFGASDRCEILMGDTNRVATAKLREKLAAHGGNCWGVLVDGNKIAVCGTGLPLTYRALDYVLTEMLSGEDGAKTLALEDGFTYIADAGENETGDAFEIADLLALGRGIRFQAVEKVAAIPPYTGYWTMQGGGTDGKYAYYCMIDKKTPTTCRIIKFNTKDWTVPTVSEPISAGHSNDLTYDPDRDCIIISTCEDPNMALVDVGSLSLNEYKQYYPNCAVEYCEKTGGFVFENCSTVDGVQVFTTMLTDRNFVETGKWIQSNNEHTCQGFCIDGDYLLCMRWVAQSETHYITVYDVLDGKFFGMMTFTGVLGEPENIFRLGDSYYVGCNQPNNIYRVVIIPEQWW